MLKENVVEIPQREKSYFKYRLNDINQIKSISELSYEELYDISKEEAEDTPFENELRVGRLNR